MKKQTQTIDTYWTHNIILGEADVPTIRFGRSLIRLHLHRSEEKYYEKHELFPLSSRTGVQIYFHAKPYILIPNITLTIALTPPKADSAEIGKVVDSNVKDLRELEIGNAQAWYYPADRALILWECFLEQPYRQKDLLADSLATMLWQSFEKELLRQLPDTERIYTTYEPIYERPIWEKFLTTQGYHHVEKVAFAKEVKQ